MIANDKTSEFVQEWNASSRQVYSFILSLLPNSADADEAFQETGRVLWERFGEFQSGTSFISWACRTAFLKAMELRRRKRRSPLVFSDAFVEAVERGFPQHVEALNARHAALTECMEKLSVSDRDLLAPTLCLGRRAACAFGCSCRQRSRHSVLAFRGFPRLLSDA
jgi:RNA polymerase sigma-70 factor (ECF subfamily)